MSDRNARSKRTSFVINLIETPHGFSLVEGIEHLNKPAEKPNPITLVPPIPTSSSKDHTTHPILKELKPVFKKNNLIFVKASGPSPIHTPIIKEETPRIMQKYASWFQLDHVHPIERDQISSWQIEMSQQLNSESQQFDIIVAKYHQQRNTIVQLYQQHCLENGKYLSVAKVRQYICDDAYWLMKIHLFLTNIGVINSNIYNYQQEANNQSYIFKRQPNMHTSLYSSDLQSHPIQPKHQPSHQLLKTITHQLRPYCDYCAIHCGIVWFQHLRIVDAKEVQTIMKNVNSKNPPLAEKEYEYILCPQCYCDANFPLLLTHQDFKKVTVNDKLEPNRKKKKDKKKKKQKKKELKEKEAEDYNEEFDVRDNLDSEKSLKDRSPPENEEEEEMQKEKAVKEKEDVGAMISKILANQKAKKEWSLAQTEALLDAVLELGENWNEVYQRMRSYGYCQNVDVESLIFYFLSLPIKGVSKLKEEYSNEEFLQANFLCNKTNTLDMISEQKLNDAIHIHSQLTPQDSHQLNALKQTSQSHWKNQLDSIMKLEILKFTNRLQYLARIEQATKDSRYLVEKNCRL